MMQWISNPSLLKGWVLSRLPARSAVRFHYWGRVLARRLEPEVHLVARLVTPELMAVDVGANYGVYTAAMLKAGARVAAFEPLAECAEALRYHSERYQGRLMVFENALSDHAGEAALHLPRDQSRLLTGFATLSELSMEHEDRRVELRTLDSYELGGVRLIKIDVEGHEQSVIRGATKTISDNNQPSLIIEIEQARLDQPITDVFDMICGLGYEGWFHRGGRLVPLPEFRLERDQPSSGVIVHNFLFVNPNERWRLGV
jgi:FkbM family methyltransferase